MKRTKPMKRARRLNGFMGTPVETIATYMIGEGAPWNEASVRQSGQQGVLTCEDCTVLSDYIGDLHNKNGSLRRRGGFVAKGNHDVGCAIGRDPGNIEAHKKMRQALRDGKSVLIDLSFETGAGGMSLEFSALAKGADNGLWVMRDWEANHKGYELVKAHDAEELVAYLAIAERYKNNSKRHLVFIKDANIVQSYDRFVNPKVDSVVADAIELVKQKSINTRDVKITVPTRMFLFAASRNAKDLAASDAADSELLNSTSTEIETPAKRTTFFGLKLEHTNNRKVLRSGPVFRAVAAPSFDGYLIRDLRDVSNGHTARYGAKLIGVKMKVTPDHIAYPKKSRRRKAARPQARAA